MIQYSRIRPFMDLLFDDEREARQAAWVVTALLQARSPRLSDLSHRLPGRPQAAYKRLQRFLAASDPQRALLRLLDAEAAFVLADVTEIERPQARRTEYVGTLKDGKTPGFWLLTLATPFRGRALPFHCITYSSRTLADEATSRNREHQRAAGDVREVVADKVLVFDREFSYRELLAALVAEGLPFVIRLNLGRHPPTFTNAEGRQVHLRLLPGEQVCHRSLYYKGEVPVNVAGVWPRGLKEPLWLVTNLEPEEALAIYHQRAKIEQSFKDLKNLLHLDKVMHKRRVYLEKMLALVLIAYVVGLLLGEALRDRLYGPPAGPGQGPSAGRRRKWHLYSGLFVLLKHKIPLSAHEQQRLCRQVLHGFRLVVIGHVRT